MFLNILWAILTRSSLMSDNSNQQNFFCVTDKILPISLHRLLIGHCKNGPKRTLLCITENNSKIHFKFMFNS